MNLREERESDKVWITLRGKRFAYVSDGGEVGLDSAVQVPKYLKNLHIKARVTTDKGSVLGGQYLEDASVAGEALTNAMKKVAVSPDFVAASDNSVSWSGKLRLLKSPEITLNAGSIAGLTSTLTYIYWSDQDIYNLHTTTDPDDISDNSVIVLATCRAAAFTGLGAMVVPVIGTDAASAIFSSVHTNYLTATQITATYATFNWVSSNYASFDWVSTNYLLAEEIAFYTLKESIIATINASPEGLRISGSRIIMDGTVQFGSGYDPTTKTTSSDVTTIINGTVTAGYITALRGITLYSSDSSNWLNVLSNGLEFSNTDFYVSSQGNNLLQVTLNGHLKLGNAAQWTVWDSGNSSFAASSHTHVGGDITSAVANASNAGYAMNAGNADTLDGSHSSAFASASHNHDGVYLKGCTGQTLGGGPPSGGSNWDVVPDVDTGNVWLKSPTSGWRQIA